MTISTAVSSSGRNTSRSLGRSSALVLVVMATALIFAIPLLEHDMDPTPQVLYVLPILLAAMTYGVRGGVATASAVLVLFGVWVLATGYSIDALDWIMRGVAALGVGWLAGHLTDRRARDLRESEDAEAKLRTSEARYRRFIDNTADAFVITDGDGSIVDVNRAMSSLTGYSREELLTMTIRDLNPAVGADRIRQDWRDIEQSGESTAFERWSERKDGSRYPAEIRIGLFEDEDGQRFGVALIRDISRRAEAEAQIRIQAELLEQVSAAVVATDAELRITHWNSGAERVYGWSRSEAVGRTVPELEITEQDELERTMGSVLTADSWTWEGELELRRKDDTRLPVHANNSAVWAQDGSLAGFVSVAIDLSDQKRTEADLRTRIEQQVAVAELGRLVAAPNTPLEAVLRDAVGIVARGLGVEHAAVLELTANQEELSVRVAVGLDDELVDTATVSADEQDQAGYTLHLAGPVIVDDLERDNRFEDASPFDGGAKGSSISLAIRAEQAPFGVIVAHSTEVRKFSDDDAYFVQSVAHLLANAIARDRAERLARQLEDARRLESIGQLAGGIAHDFNNLLAVMLNYVSFVDEELPETERSMHEDLAEVRKAAERAAELTRRLLTFSRREGITPEILDLNSIVRETESLLRSTLEENIALVINLEPNLWTVKMGIAQIEQVLLNLAVNARDAMRDGGTLTIATENLTVDHPQVLGTGELERGRYACITVADTGAGMSTEVATQAFDPFFTTKPTGEGTGLGLATVYGIVQEAGGLIAIESDPERGSLFRIHLPAVPLDGPSLPPGAPRGPREEELEGQGKTILVAEDEERVRDLTTRILSTHGYEVLQASNGYEARILCDQHQGPIDLLLTDVVMPGMSGKQLSQEIADLRPTTKTLYMSGYPDGVISRRGMVDQGTQIVEKPFTPDTLLRRVRQVVAP